MAKIDDTNEVPTTLTAPWVKRFFKRKLGIPVRVENIAGGRGYVRVWIQHYRHPDRPRCLAYNHAFTPEFGNRCLRLVYPTSEQMCSQNWGGNIEPHSIAMRDTEFRQLVVELLDSPLEVTNA